MHSLSEFKVGDRVQLHPVTDAWMRGDRYGTVTAIGRYSVSVKLDKSGATRRIAPQLILEIIHE